MYKRGYDSVTTEPGAKESVTCRICGSLMDVARSITGPTNWSSAVAKHNVIHDHWTCPNAAQAWHAAAARIIEANEKEPSPTVAALRQKDLGEILNRHRGE